MVYVDGSHLFEDVFVDFYFLRQLLSEGGIILFDDSSDPHVAKVVCFIRNNFREQLSPFCLDPFRPDKGRPLKYRLAKILRRNHLTAFKKIGDCELSWNAPFRNF